MPHSQELMPLPGDSNGVPRSTVTETEAVLAKGACKSDPDILPQLGNHPGAGDDDAGRDDQELAQADGRSL